MSKFTTIPITSKTRTRLRALKLYPRESLESVIIRLLDNELDETSYYMISEGRFRLKCCMDWVNYQLIFYDDNGLVFYYAVNDRFPSSNEGNGWDEFTGKIMGVDNLINILSVLELGDVLLVDGLEIARTY